jgi:hypothetical protein
MASKREAVAVEVLQAGGYFRKALEQTYMGEKFCVRLRTATGGVVKGVGFATLEKFLQEGKLVRREVPRSSAWGQEWGWKEAA